MKVFTIICCCLLGSVLGFSQGYFAKNINVQGSDMGHKIHRMYDGFLIQSTSEYGSFVVADGYNLAKISFDGTPQWTAFGTESNPSFKAYFQVSETDFDIAEEAIAGISERKYYADNSLATSSVNGLDQFYDFMKLTKSGSGNILGLRKQNGTNKYYLSEVLIPIGFVSNKFMFESALPYFRMEPIGNKLIFLYNEKIALLNNSYEFEWEQFLPDSYVFEQEYLSYAQLKSSFIKPMNDNSFIMAYPVADDGVIQLMDITGTVIWTKNIANSMVYNVVAASDGGYYVLGGRDNDVVYWAWISKLDAAGNTLWTRQYSIGNECSFADALEMPNGDITIVGSVLDPTLIYFEGEPTYHSDILLLTTDSLGCQTPDCSGTEIIDISIPLSDKPVLAEDKNIQLFPNPADASITLQSNASSGNWQLYNAQGQLMQTASYSIGQQEIATHHLANGFYILACRQQDGQISKHKILVQH